MVRFFFFHTVVFINYVHGLDLRNQHVHQGQLDEPHAGGERGGVEADLEEGRLLDLLVQGWGGFSGHFVVADG